jgi:predicted aspartyl protease
VKPLTKLILAVVCTMPAGARASCTLGAVAVLPITVEQGHLTFGSDLNGHPTRFMLDTGAFATLVDRAAAARLGVKLTNLDFDAYGIGGTQHLYHGKAARWRFGGLNADGQSIGAADMAVISAKEHLDGVFGMNMMAAYDIDLDLVGGHVVLYEADGQCHKPTVALAPELYSVPLEPIVNNRQIMINIRVEGHLFRALLDTGAPTTTMFRGAASHLGLDLSPMHAPGHKVVGGAGSFPVAAMSYTAKNVTIGDLQINNMPIVIIDQKDDGTDREQVGTLLGNDDITSANGEDILLGVDFMRKMHLWVSHSSHTLILQYPPLPSKLAQ